MDLVHIVFTGSCGCWILFLEKLDPGDPRFAPIKLIDSGGYWTIKLETGIAKHCLGAKIVVYACL